MSEWPPDSSTGPETPMLDQIKAQTEDLNKLRRFLEWLCARPDVVLCGEHEHTDACRGAGDAIECGIQRGMPEAMTATDERVLALPDRFLGIDRAQEKREYAALAEWMLRDRPGGRAA